MSLRFICTGDLQIHPWKQFSYIRKDGMNSRLYNCLKVFDILLEEAKKRGITKILINGDIFEENTYIDVEVFDATYLKLEKLYDAGMEICINLGNHDVSRQSDGRILHSLRAFRKIAHVLEKPELVWKHLQVVPWDTSPDRIKAAIKFARATKGTCLVGHFGVQGAKTGPAGYLVRNPIKLADIIPSKWGLVILSDYHTRQRLSTNPEVWYLGSPLQHSFGEVHRPCIWAISLDREGIFGTERIYTDFPRFRRVQAATKRELYATTKSFAGDYVRVAGDIPEHRIREVANEVGFRYQIGNRNENENGRRLEDSFKISRKQLDTRRAFRKYVRREAKGRLRQEKLLNLGEKLYRGEI